MGLAQTAGLKTQISNIHACIDEQRCLICTSFFAPGRRISVFAPGVQPGDLVATKLNPLLPHAVPEAITAQVPAT